MNLLKTGKKLLSIGRCFLISCKNRQVVLVDITLRVIIVLPDKAAVFPVLRYDAVSYDRFILISGIKIKEKDALRIKIVIDKAKTLNHILILKQIVQTVTYAYDSPDCAIKFKRPHVLIEVKNIMP